MAFDKRLSRICRSRTRSALTKQGLLANGSTRCSRACCAHLRAILKDWRAHYNRTRPHMALGPGVPDPPRKTRVFQAQRSRHRMREGFVVLAKPVLGGLHHEYSLVPVAG